ncbi:MAG: DUF4956 domain-containing protein [Thermomicrobiales bacterium]|nr:DUF4956 domain-containing protein [Thermomicrobiales bacterium]
MSQWVLIAADMVAIALLVFGLYVPRHHRRDLVVAYLGVNAGVLAISAVLSSVDATVGLGLGLFGMLSIIRLRSVELDQQEVVYYFASLALGLLGGIKIDSYAIAFVAMAAILIALWFGDHPRLLARSKMQVMTLDRAFVDEGELAAHLAGLLGAKINRVLIRRTDFVNDTTIVEVRYELPAPTVAATPGGPAVAVATRPAS